VYFRVINKLANSVQLASLNSTATIDAAESVGFMGDTRKIWVIEGYKQFAMYGPGAVKIDRLSSLINKSRSSFYHNFGDWEGFEDSLLEYHHKQSKKLAKAIATIENLFPDYADVLSGFRDWTFFHRQMFLLQHRNKKFKKAFERTNGVTGAKSSELWCKEAGLSDIAQAKTGKFFVTVREAFFTRIEYNSFSAENYIKIVKELNQTFLFMLA